MTDELLKEIIAKLTETNTLLRRIAEQATARALESGDPDSLSEIIDRAYDALAAFVKANGISMSRIKNDVVECAFFEHELKVIK